MSSSTRKAQELKIPKFQFEEEKKMRALEKQFCKTYAKINVPRKKAPFQERMEFDIFKRNSKHRRLDVLVSANRKKMNTSEQHSLYERLYLDTDRRKREKTFLDSYITSTLYTSKNSSNQKLTRKKSIELYNRFQNYDKERAKRISNQ